jgi:hypothetical protein
MSKSKVYHSFAEVMQAIAQDEQDTKEAEAEQPKQERR